MALHGRLSHAHHRRAILRHAILSLKAQLPAFTDTELAGIKAGNFKGLEKRILRFSELMHKIFTELSKLKLTKSLKKDTSPSDEMMDGSKVNALILVEMFKLNKECCADALRAIATIMYTSSLASALLPFVESLQQMDVAITGLTDATALAAFQAYVKAHDIKVSYPSAAAVLSSETSFLAGLSHAFFSYSPMSEPGGTSAGAGAGTSTPVAKIAAGGITAADIEGDSGVVVGRMWGDEPRG